MYKRQTLEKLMRVIAVVQAASQSGAALQLIEILLQAKDELSLIHI